MMSAFRQRRASTRTRTIPCPQCGRGVEPRRLEKHKAAGVCPGPGARPPPTHAAPIQPLLAIVQAPKSTAAGVRPGSVSTHLQAQFLAQAIGLYRTILAAAPSRLVPGSALCVASPCPQPPVDDAVAAASSNLLSLHAALPPAGRPHAASTPPLLRATSACPPEGHAPSAVPPAAERVSPPQSRVRSPLASLKRKASDLAPDHAADPHTPLQATIADHASKRPKRTDAVVSHAAAQAHRDRPPLVEPRSQGGRQLQTARKQSEDAHRSGKTHLEALREEWEGKPDNSWRCGASPACNRGGEAIILRVEMKVHDAYRPIALKFFYRRTRTPSEASKSRANMSSHETLINQHMTSRLGASAADHIRTQWFQRKPMEKGSIADRIHAIRASPNLAPPIPEQLMQVFQSMARCRKDDNGSAPDLSLALDGMVKNRFRIPGQPGYTPGLLMYEYYTYTLESVMKNSHLRQRVFSTSRSALQFILECVRGLQLHHDHGVLMVDLKPSNLFLEFGKFPRGEKHRSETVRVIYGDYGHACLLPSSDEVHIQTLGRLVRATSQDDALCGVRRDKRLPLGTGHYRPPESCDRDVSMGEPAPYSPTFGTASDVYQLGLTLLEVLSTRPLHDIFREPQNIQRTPGETMRPDSVEVFIRSGKLDGHLEKMFQTIEKQHTSFAPLANEILPCIRRMTSFDARRRPKLRDCEAMLRKALQSAEANSNTR